MPRISRRDFLGLGLLALPGLAQAIPAIDVEPPMELTLSRDLSVYRQVSQRLLWVERDREEAMVDVYTDEGFRRLQWLMRDKLAGNKIGVPDHKLILRLLTIQNAAFSAQGFASPIEFVSCLRLKQTNRRTAGASRDSLHVPDRLGVFRATDIRMRDTTLSSLRDIAKQSPGGVGYYGDDRHLHLDSGVTRSWHA